MAGCKKDNCKNKAIYGSDFCWDHIAEKDAYKDRILSAIKSGKPLKGANFSKADLGNVDLARANLSGVNFSRAMLSNANLFDADLKNAELVGADLSNADLTGANLEGADLTRAYMRGARLWHASLKNATLIEANLNLCDLWNAGLYNVRIWRTELSQAISISKESFRSRINRFFSRYRINEKGILSAEDAYRDLKKYFLSNGRYNDASWASFREKSMERLLLKKKGNLAYIPSLIMNLICGYGEKPERIIFSSFFVIVLFALVFRGLDAITYSQAVVYTMTVWDYIYYSVITFTTVGYGDFIPKAAFLYRALAATEAFTGTFMIGLFIFTLARKYSAR